MNRALLALLFICPVEAIAAVDGVVGLNPPSAGSAISVQFETGAGSISSVEWFHNDQQTFFPSITLLEGIEGAPPSQTGTGLVLWNGEGPSLGWGYASIDPPVFSSTGVVDVIFSFPDMPLTGEGENTGPGLGYQNMASATPSFISADGVDWTAISSSISVAVALGVSAQKATVTARALSNLDDGPEMEASDDTSDPTGTIELVISPNPFNPRTRIQYTVREAAFVKLSIFNSRGRLVRQVVPGFQRSGRYAWTWNGTDETSSKVSSGVYFVRLSVGAETRRQRISLIR